MGCQSLSVRFGGSYGIKQGYGNGIYEWRCYGKSARSFLENISPYLIHKQEQAKLGLAKFGTFDDKCRKEMMALNSRNNKGALSKFWKRYNQCPKLFLIEKIYE